VSFDSKSQAYVGLPDEWKTTLEVQQTQEEEKEKEQQPLDTSSPMTPGPGESPIKPIGPSCHMCYNNVQCNACKLDTSFGTSITSPKLDYQTHSRRPRPFSVTSGTTLIGDHEARYRF